MLCLIFNYEFRNNVVLYNIKFQFGYGFLNEDGCCLFQDELWKEFDMDESFFVVFLVGGGEGMGFVE